MVNVNDHDSKMVHLQVPQLFIGDARLKKKKEKRLEKMRKKSQKRVIKMKLISHTEQVRLSVLIFFV